MGNLWYHTEKTSIKCAYAVVHGILALKYWRKGKKVPPAQNPLLFKSATELAEGIREGKIKSVDVIQAYIDRITEVEPYLNATVDRCFLSALEEAKNVDNLIASGNYTKEELAEKKPLLGVPLTVKLLLCVKDLRCTGGSVVLANARAEEDSPCVVLMRKAGAIVIATTNIPEIGMNIETFNKVHGRTKSPYDTRRTPGGSSGGESALLSSAASVIGLGNDFAGSIRIPCHFTGLYGHKPTFGMVSNKGCYPVLDFIDEFLYTGPMCRYSEDLVATMNVLTSENETPVKFGLPVQFEKLKICYMLKMHNPLTYPVQREIQESILNAVSYFKKTYGAETKEIKLPMLFHANKCYIHKVVSKANQAKNFKYEITNGQGTHINEILDCFKFFVGKSTFTEGPLIALNCRNFPLTYRKRNVSYYKDLLENLDKELDNLLDSNTVFFFPTFPITAPYHHEIFPMFPSAAYTAVFNVIGLPSTQCHLGFTKQNMPYGMQIIGRRNNDPLTIACAVELEKAFGGWVQPTSL